VTLAAGSFGTGGAEPYARALQDGAVVVLAERHAGRITRHATLDVSRWSDSADPVDLTLLSGIRGPLLDIGCGPGRMVRAARTLGLDALGIDIEPAAVALARRNGVAVSRTSVFDSVPREGDWQTALLIDGNVGIGGDVRALLARCRDILAPRGELVIETHNDQRRHHRYTGTLLAADGTGSATFPWAEIGCEPLARLARRVGYREADSWSVEGRSFSRLESTRA
jgi:SAM-dependent methyltransferase